MSAVSAVVGNQGRGHSIALDGHTYTFKLVDKIAMADYEKLRFAQDRTKIVEAYAGLPMELLKEPLKEALDRYLDGTYSLLTEIEDFASQPQRVFALLEVLSPGISLAAIAALFSEKAVEMDLLFAAILQESFPGAAPAAQAAPAQAAPVAADKAAEAATVPGPAPAPFRVPAAV